MKLKSKEEFLIKQGKSIETIRFCRDLKIPIEHIVWFVDKIEKENFPIKSEKSKEHISLVLKMFLKNKKEKENTKTLSKAIFKACQVVESDESENKRVLQRFPDGNYIIQITHKEALYEGESMRNCLGSMARQIHSKEIAILALKNKVSKTLCHIQVGVYGNLSQHYGFANTSIKASHWYYINEFFKKNKSLSLTQELEQKSIEKIYDIRKDYRGLSVLSKIPYEKRISLFGDNNNNNRNNLSSIDLKEYDYFQEKKGLCSDRNLSLEEALSYIVDYKMSIIESLKDLEESLKDSKDNLLILNDKMYYRLFGKKISTKERFEKIINCQKGDGYEEAPVEMEPPLAYNTMEAEMTEEDVYDEENYEDNTKVSEDDMGISDLF